MVCLGEQALPLPDRLHYDWLSSHTAPQTMMKRYFLIFLLVLLPLQFSWAVAGTYCAHEQELTSQHFGHHVHKHDKTGDPVGEASQTAKVDLDCDYCHHVPASALFPAAPPIAGPDSTVHARFELQRYDSYIPDLIPRPDW